MNRAAELKRWVKDGQTPLARLAYTAAMALRGARVPVIRPLHGALYRLHLGLAGVIGAALRVAWWTPLFASRIETDAPGLFLYGGMPQVLGPLRLRFGRGCRVSGRTTLIGRTGTRPDPVLEVGDNVDIGWQTTIAVGDRVVLGDNVRLAGRCLLAGFPGHPMDAAARARGAADSADQVGPIVLEPDVWLATGVTVLAGVRIGRGTVVATGSVVTRDLPAGVLAAGVPARVVRPVDEPARQPERQAARQSARQPARQPR
jgi:acetyltransferase-like isoleucine patch superfamily enzyme